MNPALTLAPELLAQLPEPLRLVVLQMVGQLQAFQSQTQLLQNQVQSLTVENQLLRQKLDALIRRYFGSPKNETLDPNQLLLLLAGLTQTPAPVPPTPAKPAPAANATANRQPARSGIPENLPIEKVVLLPDEVKANPDQFRQIDELVTRELDYEPGRFFWRHWVRPKFVRQAADVSVTEMTTTSEGKLSPLVLALTLAPLTEAKEVLIADLPNRLIEKGLPGVGLLVHLILSRFEDHLPFYRLEKIFRQRHGVPIARQTLVDWTERLADWLSPVYREMIAGLIAADYLQADETPIQYLDREVPGRSCTGYFWVYSQPGGDVIFEWKTSRGRDGPKEFLKDFKGKLQCDGYGVYRSLAKEQADWILIACWAHCRRYFYEAKGHDRRTAWFLKQISLLYAIERRLRQQKAGPNLRQAVRAAEAKPVLARIGKALEKIGPKVLPQSLLGKAIGYAQGLWVELNRYVGYGEVEIDNNPIENSIRPTAVGKKNFLFIGHPEAGQRSAVIYSILGSCHRHGINPALYLRDVLSRLPDMQQSEVPTITPKAWAKAHPEARVLPPK
jgi:hypothetical protein